jgi:hypothetical protein
MTRIFRIVILTFALIVIICFGTILFLPYYDTRTRTELVHTADIELPVNAPMPAMEMFMRRHALHYGIDDSTNFQLTGVVSQSIVDRILFDRKVYIILKFDKNTHLFNHAESDVAYTFL